MIVCDHPNTYYQTYLGNTENWVGLYCPQCDTIVERVPDDLEGDNKISLIMERLATYCPPPKKSFSFEDFKERWDYWRTVEHPNTLVGDRETNNHLIRTGWSIRGPLPALGIEEVEWSADQIFMLSQDGLEYA